MASSSASPKPSIGILSIGDMGMAIAKVLLANDYPVLTVSAGRSTHTLDRIKSAGIQDLPSDEALLTQVDILLSIVPPRDALPTAKRIAEACRPAAGPRRSAKGPTAADIIYIDLNAISPRTVAKIAALFENVPSTPLASPPSLARRLTRSLSIAGQDGGSGEASPPPPITIKLLDGGIIGPPPTREKDKDKANDKDKATDDSTATTKDKSTDPSSSSSSSTQPITTSSPTNPGWTLPSIPLSGPHESLLPPSLLKTLNMHFISPTLGTASSLKACFASLTKGLTALTTLSYTTASTCGVLPALQSHLDVFAPGLRPRLEKSLVSMPPKAYRWVDEMNEIGSTFARSGGLPAGDSVMRGVGEVYRVVAEETVLGSERVGKRKRGVTVEDFVAGMEEGVVKRRGGKEGKDEKLELAWRGSWGL